MNIIKFLINTISYYPRSGGAAMATDIGIELGDKIHKNTNETIAVMTNYMDVMKKYKHLADQLNFEKEKHGMEFALKKLMSMKELGFMERKILMMELTNRESVKSSALNRQQSEYGFRQQILDDKKKKQMGNAFALGFAKAIKGDAKGSNNHTKQNVLTGI